MRQPHTTASAATATLDPAGSLFSARLVDFFFIAGGPVLTAGAQQHQLQLPQPSTASTTSLAATKALHPTEIKYVAAVTARYPPAPAHGRDPFPPHMPLFCFPAGGMSLLHHDGSSGSTSQSPGALPLPPSRFHTFIVTDDTGVKTYGTCLTVYEPLSDSEQSVLQQQLDAYKSAAVPDSEVEYIAHIQQKLADAISTRDAAIRTADDTVVDEHVALYESLLAPYARLLQRPQNFFRPKCVGLLSKWPFYSAFRDWLIKVTCDHQGDCALVPLERLVAHIVAEVPLPPPGKLDVSVRLDSIDIRFSRPPLNSLPVIRSFSLYPLFAALSLENVITVFEHVVAEQKVLLLSDHPAMLTAVAESLVLLLFPLFWQHVYIPLLPAQMCTYIHAPVPYIIGLLNSCRHLESIPDDVLVVDLDRNQVTVPSRAGPFGGSHSSDLSDKAVRPSAPYVPSIPPHQRRKLMDRLAKCCRMARYKSPTQVPRPITRPESQPDFWLSSIPIRRNQQMQFDLTRVRDEILAARQTIKRHAIHSVVLDGPAVGGDPIGTIIAPPSPSKQLPPTPTVENSTIDMPVDPVNNTEEVGLHNAMSMATMVDEELPETFIENNDQVALESPTGSLMKDLPYMIQDELVIAVHDSSEFEVDEDGNGVGPLPPAKSATNISVEMQQYSSRNLSSETFMTAQSGKQMSTASSIFATPTNGTSPVPPSRTSSIHEASQVDSSKNSIKKSSLLTGRGDVLAPMTRTATVQLTVDTGHVRRGSTQPSTTSSSPRKIMQQLSGFIENSKIRIQTSMASIDAVAGNNSKSSSSSTLHSLEKNSTNKQFSSIASGLDLELQSPMPASKSYSTSLGLEAGSSDQLQALSPSSAERERFFYPFRYQTSSQIDLDQKGKNVHSSFIPPQEYLYAMRPEDFPPEIQLMVCPSTTSSDAATAACVPGHEGHVFWRLFTVATNSATVEIPKHKIPKYLPVGMCAVCCKPVHVPLVVANGTSWTVNGAAALERTSIGGSSQTLQNQQKFAQSDGMGCEGCRQTVHAQCLPRLVAYCPRAFNEVKVQDAFFRMWTSLLRNYRAFIVPDNLSTTRGSAPPLLDRSMSASSGAGLNSLRSEFAGQWNALTKIAKKNTGLSSRESMPDVNEMDQRNICPAFRKREYLAQLVDKETRLFMYYVCDTQAFVQFAHDRAESLGVDYEILFFDEAIKAKLNRSKMRLTKEQTPFLQDETYNISTTVHAVPVNMKGLDMDLVRRTRLPDGPLDESLMRVPRPFNPLVTEKDSTRLKVYTNAILRRARISKTKKKPDFRDWMMDKFLGASSAELSASAELGPRTLKASASSRRANINLQIDQVYRKMEETLKEYDRLGLEESKSVRFSMMPTRASAARPMSIPSFNLSKMNFARKLDIETMLRRHVRQFQTLCQDLNSCLAELREIDTKSGSTGALQSDQSKVPKITSSEEDDINTLLRHLNSFITAHQQHIDGIANVKDEDDFEAWCRSQVEMKEEELGIIRSSYSHSVDHR